MFSGGDVFGTVHEVKRLRNTRDGNPLRSTTHHLMADPTVDFDEADAKAIFARLGLTEAGGLE